MHSYLAVLRMPGAPRAFGTVLLGRLSYGTVFLSLILAITGTTGSYAVAGTAMALFGLAVSLLSPLRAALIDRYGPRRALPPMAAAYALLLACLAVVTWRPEASATLLWPLAAAAGACAPPLGPVMRTLWSDLVPDRASLQRAYSLDAVAEELIFVMGPLLAGLFLLVDPAAGVAVSAVLVLGGTLGFVSCPAVRAMDAVRTEPREGPAREPSRMWLRGSLPQAVAVSAAVGLCLGVPGLLVVAFAEQRGQVAMVAWIEAAQAVGSALGGAVYGAVSWRISLRVRLPLLAAALGLALAVAGLAPNVYALMAVLFVAGVFTAPALTTAYLLADESAAPEHRTQAGAWVNTAFNTGFSGGNAAAGLLASRLPLALCFSIAVIPALLSTTTTLRRPKRSPEPLAMTSSVGSGPDE